MKKLNRPVTWLVGVSTVLAGYLAVSSRIWSQLDASQGTGRYTLFLPFLFLLGAALWLTASGLFQFLTEITDYENTWKDYRREENLPHSKRTPALLAELGQRKRLQLNYAMVGLAAACIGSIAVPLTQLVLMPFLSRMALTMVAPH